MKRKSICRDYALCVLGALFVAVGVYFFKFPNQFSTGGVSGISVILSGYFHISSASVLMTAINILMLLIGFLCLGKDCGVKTLVGSLTLSGALLVLETWVPLTHPLTDEPMLELAFAVLFPAVGSAILFNGNGSTGGTDILAMILKKYTSLNIGTALLCSDLLITLGAFLFGIRTGLFSLLGLLFKSLVVDSVIENLNLCKCFTIITNHPQKINDYITHTVCRSCTVLEATGGYTQQHTYLVISVMRRAQAIQLRRWLKEEEPEAFMIITNSSEIVGKGFRGAR